MRFDDMFTNGEPQAGATFVAATRFIGSVKSFEYTGQVFFVNANTVVADLYQYFEFVGIVHTGYNGSVRLSIFRTVGNQVD